MSKRFIQNAFSDLQKLSKNDIAKRKLSFKFYSEFLNYQPYLKDFSSQHYKIFDEIASQLNLQGSIEDLFNAQVVNKTENRPALHHQYRIDQKSKAFNYKNSLLPVKY